MKLSECALLADENIDSTVVEALRLDGQDVASVRDLNLVSVADHEVMRLAFEQRRVILTHDTDFGELAIARAEPLVGVVLIRPGHIQATFTLGTIKAVWRDTAELEPPFVVSAVRVRDEVVIRVRHLPV